MPKPNYIESFLYSSYILIYLLDPTGLVLKLKLPSLLLVLLYSIYIKRKINYTAILLIVLSYIIISFSTINMLLHGYIYETSLLISYFTTFINVFPILFIIKDKRVFIKPFFIACTILSVLIIVISFTIWQFQFAIYFFDLEPWKTIFIIQSRPILGKNFSMVYHLSSSVLILGLGYNFFSYLLLRQKKKLLLSMLYALALFFTGARANILSECLVLFFILVYYEFKIRKRILFTYVLMFLIVIGGIFFIFLLLTDANSGSSYIKHGHIVSTLELFESNLNIFLFGNGPGSLFFSKGFKSMTAITELSYLDLIRLFGVFGTVGIILMYVYPLISFWRSKNVYSFVFFISYLAYLFIAGTNPLLIVPQGFIVLFINYNLSYDC